jgi:hypothetical protein
MWLCDFLGFKTLLFHKIQLDDHYPEGAFGNLSAAPGVGATLSEDAAGVMRHKRDPLSALSSALAGLKVNAERTHADERRAALASGLHKFRGADSAFSAAAGGGASVGRCTLTHPAP